MHPIHSLGMLINNRYQIQKLLGRGGFGQTYLAFDTQCFDHPCVLKEFAPASRADYAVQKARQLFEREARILYEIDHAQIPKFLAWFVDRGRLFLVQEYVAGKTYAQLLRQRQQQGRTFSETEVIYWMLDLLPVFQYLHQRQIVHRDVSPDNIILPDRSGAKPVLIDFGLVKQTLNQIYSQIHEGNRSRVETASFVGKFGYAPPEQIRMGQCSPSSDLYALGVTALVLLTGQEPRLLMDQESLEWHWQNYVNVSDRLAQVLEKMVQDKPKARFQSVEEVVIALRPIVAPSVNPVSMPPSLPTSPASKAALTAASSVSRPTAPPPDLDIAFLERCQQELTRCIGPIANFVLENTLAQYPHATLIELVNALTLEIPDPIQASAFQSNLMAALQNLSLTMSYAATSQASFATERSPLSPDFLERCQQALTRCIGPVAALILDDLLMQNPQMTQQQLIEAIVNEIPNARQAAAFEQAMQ